MTVLPHLWAQDFGEHCYYYLGDHPNHATPGWNQNAQGVAHDRDHWFITQTERIWKIPVQHDLRSQASGAPGVITVSLCDEMRLCGRCDILGYCELYKHFGDPECFDTNGQTFLVVPVEGDAEHGYPAAPHPAIAVFRANTLEYVKHADLTQQVNAPWCAVDPQGRVYSSNWVIDNGNPIRRYEVDWERLIASGELHLTNISTVPLLNERGEEMSLPHVQGGVITPSGTLIYLVAGDGETFPVLETDGIHVFDLRSGRRVMRSTRGFGPFNFEFHPEFPIKEEPEGLTFWDLDDGRAPGISGQLHVLLLDNDAPDDDEIYLKHYAGTLHVDRSYNGINGTETGSLRQPFNTVNEANNLIWDGAQIKIKSASYPEPLVFSKRIAVVSSGGPVTIGR